MTKSKGMQVSHGLGGKRGHGGLASDNNKSLSQIINCGEVGMGELERREIGEVGFGMGRN